MLFWNSLLYVSRKTGWSALFLSLCNNNNNDNNNNSNMYSKNFDKRSHCRWGQIFCGFNVIWHRPVGSITVSCSSCTFRPLVQTEWSLLSCAVIDNWMISFAAYTTAVNSSAFKWARQPQKFPIPIGDLDPHRVHVSLGPLESATKWHLNWFSCYCTAPPCDQHIQRPSYAWHL